MAPQPEQQARANIDALLKATGWQVCDAARANIHAAQGVAIREFPLATPSPRVRGEGRGEGYGFADYLLYVDGKAAGVIQAKKEGVTLPAPEMSANLVAALEQFREILGDINGISVEVPGT